MKISSGKRTRESGETTQSRVTEYLRREFGVEKNGAKCLSRLAACSVRTAEKWIAGLSVPGGDYLSALLMHQRFRDGFTQFLDATARPEHHELAARIAGLRNQLEWIEQSLRQKDVRDANTPCVSKIGLALHTRGVRTPRHG